jgi:hypothetical protein
LLASERPGSQAEFDNALRDQRIACASSPEKLRSRGFENRSALFAARPAHRPALLDQQARKNRFVPDDQLRQYITEIPRSRSTASLSERYEQLLATHPRRHPRS